MPATVPAPVDRLLALGPIDPSDAWHDAVALGLTPEDVPALIQLATDPDLLVAPAGKAESWGPVHAWRALGQLRAESAIEPLVALLGRTEDDDWIFEELPVVFGMIGLPAVPALARLLADPSAHRWSRVAAADSLANIAKEQAARIEAIATLIRQLEHWDGQDEILSGTLVGRLAELKAVEAAPLMKAAFAADRVNISFYGDWEDIQVEMGLLERRLTPRPDYQKELRAQLGLPRFQFPPRETKARPTAKDRAKAKRKAARASRKRNRRAK